MAARCTTNYWNWLVSFSQAGSAPGRTVSRLPRSSQSRRVQPRASCPHHKTYTKLFRCLADISRLTPCTLSTYHSCHHQRGLRRSPHTPSHRPSAWTRMKSTYTRHHPRFVSQRRSSCTRHPLLRRYQRHLGCRTSHASTGREPAAVELRSQAPWYCQTPLFPTICTCIRADSPSTTRRHGWYSPGRCRGRRAGRRNLQGISAPQRRAAPHHRTPPRQCRRATSRREEPRQSRVY